MSLIGIVLAHYQIQNLFLDSNDGISSGKLISGFGGN